MEKKIIIRVRLEPVLEEMAELWVPWKRRAMAAKFERWARQLRVSAAILEADCQPPPRRVRLFLHPRKARLN